MNDYFTIRLAGMLAITGAFLCAVSDLLLMCGPISGEEVNLALLASIPYERTLIGAILGVAVIPLWLFILIPLYHALKPAGKRFTIPVVLLFVYNIVVSTVYHGAYAFYGAGYHALVEVGGDTSVVITEMMDRFMAFRSALIYITMIPIILGSIWFIIAVLFRTTHYKRWMVIFTPLLVMLALILLKPQLPAPIGGFIVPPAGSIVYMIFFTLTTIVTWKKGLDHQMDTM